MTTEGSPSAAASSETAAAMASLALFLAYMCHGSGGPVPDPCSCVYTLCILLVNWFPRTLSRACCNCAGEAQAWRCKDGPPLDLMAALDAATSAGTLAWTLPWVTRMLWFLPWHPPSARYCLGLADQELHPIANCRYWVTGHGKHQAIIIRLSAVHRSQQLLPGSPGFGSAALCARFVLDSLFERLQDVLPDLSQCRAVQLSGELGLWTSKQIPCNM